MTPAAQATPRTPSSRQAAPVTTSNHPSLAAISSKGSGLPNRTVLHAVEGWGKTSFAAQTVKPVFIETKGETGLETLIDSGRLPEVPHFPESQTWDDLLGAIETLTVEDHPYRTLALDTVNGAERLCHEYVCERDFNNDWGERGFMGYMRGFEVSLAEWRKFLNALDRLRAEKRMAIVALCHTKVKPFKNPEGADYDRYTPDMHDKTWGLTHKWADVVLFGNFEVTLTAVQENKKTGAARGKGAGGNHRMLFTERHASYDAKNRLGLPAEVDMGSNAAEAWANFMAAVKQGREAANG
ncbi:MAG: ATP-binding protein [Bryobacteraceae bacterium]|jgi:hypothetical protein